MSRQDVAHCLGIEVEPGVMSGCTAKETGARDCPSCGGPICHECCAVAPTDDPQSLGWQMDDFGGEPVWLCKRCLEGPAD